MTFDYSTMVFPIDSGSAPCWMEVFFFEQIRRPGYRKILILGCRLPRPVCPLPPYTAAGCLSGWSNPRTETTMARSDAATERFIDAENVILLRSRLTETIDPAQRLQLLRLLAEQEAKRHSLPE